MGLSEPGHDLNELSRAVIGAAIEVHRTLGPGFLESVYEQALHVEFEIRNISHAQQCPIGVRYKGTSVGESRLDFLVADRLVVEIKAVETLLPVHRAQVLSYLRTTNHILGLLINFNVRVLSREGVERIVLTSHRA